MPGDDDLRATHDQLEREVALLRQEVERISAAGPGRPRGWWHGVGVGLGLVALLLVLGLVVGVIELFAHFPGG